jgi:hypothetical protein
VLPNLQPQKPLGGVVFLNWLVDPNNENKAPSLFLQTQEKIAAQQFLSILCIACSGRRYRPVSFSAYTMN